MPRQKPRQTETGIILGAVVFAMICLAFASVPLYRLFCQQTGYGGTPQIAALPGEGKIVKDRLLRIQFNADVSRDLPWRFIPLQHEIKVHPGQVALAFYQAENRSTQPVIGMAVYNVTPEKAGIYFNKVECFCFIEQRLNPGEIVDMPVQFFIDPEIDKDPLLDDVTTLTLSYTFFPFKK